MHRGLVEDRRTVHASNDEFEVVRYDRASKWFIEPKGGGLPRQAVTLRQAVDMARHLWYHADGTPHFGKPGGTRFDQLLRKLEKDGAPR